MIALDRIWAFHDGPFVGYFVGRPEYGANVAEYIRADLLGKNSVEWDDDICRAFAEGYDREDAAQRGEPCPSNSDDPEDDAWRKERIACVRAGLGAAVLQAIQRNVKSCKTTPAD